MAPLAKVTMVVSGLILDALSFVFFRWIPGHQLPPLIYSAALIQITCFLISNKNSMPDELGNDTSKRKSVLPRRSWWPLYALLINAAVVFNVVDVVYRPIFFDSNGLSLTRVGYVSHESARLLVREPDVSKLPLFVTYKEDAADIVDWKIAAEVNELSQDKDFAQTVSIERLTPSTLYKYETSNNRSGSFKTAPAPGELDPSERKFTFLTSSCIKTRFPFNPLSHPRSIPGLQHLSQWIPKLHAHFMLFLGDFIYVDVPLRHGSDVETYRHEYRQVYSSPDWPAVANDLPWLHVIDDHEIANDWDKGLDEPYLAAIDPWDIYHASVNPPSARSNASYYEFTQGPASFFMMDTRRFRSPEHAESSKSSSKTMLGPEQLSSLLSFLRRSEPQGVRWKFVISSIPFTQNWRVNAVDTWAGYLHERRIILEAMWDVGLSDDGVGVIVLSGDRHEFAATAFPPPRNGKWPSRSTVHEFSTSPLSMFYLPFRSYWEVDDQEEEEHCIKYIPDGNSKFGAIELEEGLLRFRLFVDGKESWQHAIMTP